MAQPLPQDGYRHTALSKQSNRDTALNTWQTLWHSSYYMTEIVTQPLPQDSNRDTALTTGQ
jgi:hypothetical protein